MNSWHEYILEHLRKGEEIIATPNNVKATLEFLKKELPQVDCCNTINRNDSFDYANYTGRKVVTFYIKN